MITFESGDAERQSLVANTEANGRFHSDWLTMIYSRLRLAKNFLSEDGVIFISIDDSEATTCAKCATKIFGEEKFIATDRLARTN